MIIKLVFLLSTLYSIQAINWYYAETGQIEWAHDCDFNGIDIANMRGQDEDCGRACLAMEECSAYAWTSYAGGTCWLKSGGEAYDEKGSTCGKVVKRNPVRIQTNKSKKKYSRNFGYHWLWYL